jgi:3-deoxy-D-manno-octulosonic-acid transferase
MHGRQGGSLISKPPKPGVVASEVRVTDDGRTRGNALPAPNLWRIALDPRLILWNLFMIGIGPLALALKIRRFVRKRANHEFTRLRWDIPNLSAKLPPPEHPHLILAGASFGEMLLMDRITKALIAEEPRLTITWAIRDPRTLEQLRRERPHQRVAVWPYDSLPPVLKWVRQNPCDALVFVERFSFPTLAGAAKLAGARVSLVNGRVKPSGLPALSAPYYRWLLGNFSVLCFQNETYAKRAQKMAPEGTVVVTGNVKLDLPHRPLTAESAAEVENWLLAGEPVPILAAGSTNNEEEERFVLEAFKTVRRRTPCRLLLAPRKFERVPEVMKVIAEAGLTASRRTKNSPPADVMVLDTMGELAHCYQFCKAAYVGGSYNGMGHNVAEPVQWGVPVSYGMRRGHFEDLQKACERAGVGFRVGTSLALADHWTRAITDEMFELQVRESCKGLFANEEGALERTIQQILATLR